MSISFVPSQICPETNLFYIVLVIVTVIVADWKSGGSGDRGSDAGGGRNMFILKYIYL